MTNMLRLSEEVHESIVRQILPEATDEQVDFVVYKYPEINPLRYSRWRDGLKKSFPMKNDDEIDNVYITSAIITMSHPNPLMFAVRAEIDMFGETEDEDKVRLRFGEHVRAHEFAALFCASVRSKDLSGWVE